MKDAEDILALNFTKPVLEGGFNVNLNREHIFKR